MPRPSVVRPRPWSVARRTRAAAARRGSRCARPGCGSDVIGTSSGGHRSPKHGAQVVRVDLLSQAHVALRHPRTDWRPCSRRSPPAKRRPRRAARPSADASCGWTGMVARRKSSPISVTRMPRCSTSVLRARSPADLRSSRRVRQMLMAGSLPLPSTLRQRSVDSMTEFAFPIGTPSVDDLPARRSAFRSTASIASAATTPITHARWVAIRARARRSSSASRRTRSC